MTTNLQAVANRVYKAVAGNEPVEGRNRRYDLSRTDYRIMKRTALKEYKKAKDLGYSDTEILDALYSGTGSQVIYAKFIENEIVGKEL